MPKPKVRFADPAQPSADEIRAWANCNDPEPLEDWDVVLAEPSRAGVLVDLVAQEKCPSRRYLLGALYLLVGEAVRTQFAAVALTDLEPLIDAARASGDAWLGVWADRSEHLVAHPDAFDYRDWCAGGPAKRPMT